MTEIFGIPSTVANLSGQRLMQRHSPREERSKRWLLSLAERASTRNERKSLMLLR